MDIKERIRGAADTTDLFTINDNSRRDLLVIDGEGEVIYLAPDFEESVKEYLAKKERRHGH